MAINFTTRMYDKLVQAWSKGTYLEGRTSNRFKWVSDRFLEIYSMETVPTVDYNRTTTGANRYGNLNDVQDHKQTMEVTQDKAVALVVDKGDFIQNGKLKKTATVIKEEQDKVIKPETDAYAFGKYVAGAGTKVTLPSASTKDDIKLRILAGRKVIVNQGIKDLQNVSIFVTTDVYIAMLQLEEFINVDQMANKALRMGEVGKFFKMPVIELPDGYLPENTEFLMAHKDSVILPRQVKEVKVHEKPQGVSGVLIEFRNIYDAFVIEELKMGVYTASYTQA